MSEQNNHDTTNNSRRNPAAADGPSTQTAYFAGGCFWGLERYFQNVDGVTDTTVGYAQSKVESPSYEQVCAGVTDAAETVKVVFDPAQVTLRTLTLLFLEVIDPFSVDRQGEDSGRQYRTGMFFTDATQQSVYIAALEQLVDRQPARPAVLVEPLRNFYPAEAHHQDYLIANPGGFCHIPLAAIANVKRRQKYVEKIWDLTLEQFAVTQCAATERPFVNAYDEEFEPGHLRGCGQRRAVVLIARQIRFRLRLAGVLQADRGRAVDRARGSSHPGARPHRGADGRHADPPRARV